MTEPSSPRPAGPVTLQDIANRCGLKKTTVSHALRGLGRVSPATRARVQQVAAELGYNPAHHELARRLALRKSGQEVRTQVIACYLPLMADGTLSRYFNDLYSGLMQGFMTAGYAALLIPLNTLPNDTDSALPLLLQRGDVDGLITVFPPDRCYPLYAALRALPTFGTRPILNVIYAVRGAHFVGADDRAGAYAAAAHLLALGHRHLLLFVDQKLSPVETARLAGARDALYEQGLDPAHYLHQYPLWDGSWSDSNPKHFTTPEGEVPAVEQAARQRLADYLRAHPQITALLAQNDTTARHAWYTLIAMGRRVPEDISLIGVDDVDPFLDDQGHNLLTTVRIPLYDIGYTAGRTLIRHIEDRELPDEEILLPTSLVMRASTGPAPR